MEQVNREKGNSRLGLPAQQHVLYTSTGRRLIVAQKRRNIKRLGDWKYRGLVDKVRFLLFGLKAQPNSHISPLTSHSLAFTLSETLVTLGIIGVVAAMTLPTLNQNIQTEKFRSATKKQYSILSQSIAQIVAENGELDTSSKDNFINELSTKIKIVKKGTWESLTTLPSTFYYHCYKENSGTCGNYFYRPTHNGEKAFMTNDGTIFFMPALSSDCNGANWGYKFNQTDEMPIANLCAIIRFDLNGDTAPNQAGVDMQELLLIKNNKEYYLRASNNTSCAKGYPENYNYSTGCTQLMLLDKKMP